MCGIVGYVGIAQAAPILMEGLRRLEYRGYDSAGVAVRDKAAAHIEVVKTKGRIRNLEAATDGGKALCGTSGVGHTRWATHGEPSETNAHPHYSQNKRVVLVHNGIIENHSEIREMLTAKGYRFHTQTDTEAAALLLDLCYGQEESGPPRERALGALRAMMARLSGSYALGVLFLDQPGVVYAVRKDSPMIVGRCEGENGGHILASDVPAVLPYTRRVAYLDDMEIAVLTKEDLCVYGADGGEIDKPLHTAEWDAQAAQKGGYAHFMLKEIEEQPAAVRSTLLPRIRGEAGARSVDLSETGMTEQAWKSVRRVLFVGCGSAYHAGLVGRCAVQALAQLPCACELASELRYSDAPVEAGTLAVVISQSGETADSLAALRRCRGSGMQTLAIVNVMGSSIAREAQAVLYTHAGPEISVATTKAYAAQLAALYLLAIALAKARGTLAPGREQALLRALDALPGEIARALGERERMACFARRFARRRDVFFIGRGLDWALCMEGSLKLKEISYIHSEAYAAGELKHGAISLIDKGTLVIGAATQQRVTRKTLSGLAEAKARGAYVFALTAGECAADAADEELRVAVAEPLFAASVAVVPLQLLAYFIACELGLDVDQPRNLAKSVTVE